MTNMMLSIVNREIVILVARLSCKIFGKKKKRKKVGIISALGRGSEVRVGRVS